MLLSLLQPQTGGAAEIQHLDASLPTSVVGSAPVTQWTDQSGNSNHALQDIGSVSYPSIATFESGLTGLDVGATRNGLELFTSAESDGWLDQSSGDGFCIFLAVKVHSLDPSISDLLGNSSAQGSGLGLRFTSSGAIRAFLGGRVVTQGGSTAQAGDSIVLSMRYDPVVGEFRFWDSKNTTANFGAVAPADFTNNSDVRVGTTSNNSRFFDGVIGEVIIHDTALSLVEVEQIETALAEKWTVAPPTPALQHLDASVTDSVSGNPVTSWEDQSGNEQDATSSLGSVGFPGADTLGSGRAGLDFGAARSSLELFTAAGSDAWLDQSSGSGFSVFVAFKVGSVIGNWNDLIGNSSAVASGFGLRYATNGSPQIYLGGTQINPGGQDLEAGDTVVFSFRYDPTTSEMRFWESKNAAISTAMLPPGDFSTGNPVQLGSTTNSGRFIDGLVGEVRIYDTALSLEETAEIESSLVTKWVTGGVGPGFPNVTQVEGAELSAFWTDPVDRVVRTVVLDYVNGYVVMDTRGLAAGGSSHAHQVWDVSNPTSPVEVARIGGARGMHKSEVLLPNYRVNQSGNDYVNMTDMLNLKREAPPGYVIGSRGGRSTYLLPYHYYSGLSDNRIEIADARVSTAAIASFDDHGFTGFPIPIGNLLLVPAIRGQDTRAVAAYDISDPTSPVLLDLISGNDPVWTESAPAYEAFIWKHYLVLPNVTGSDDCAFIDFSDPSNLRWVLKTDGDGTFSTGLPGRTRYAQFQDHHMFLGGGKYDMSPLDSDQEPILVDTYLQQAGEFMLPLGNLLVSAENSEQGSIPDAGGPYPAKIYAHQAAPDTTPPTVVYHSPPADATNQHVKTRIGVVIHETLDYATINPSTFRVFPVAGGDDVAGTLNASDKDILTFTPNQDLLPSTTYRVSLEANGIQDAAGNAITGYSFDFTTADAGGGPSIDITDIAGSAYPAPVGGSTTLTATASGGTGTLEYRWDFGDGTATTPWSDTASSLSHTYTAPGHYSVLLQVRDSGSPPQISSKSFVVTVATPLTGPFPTKASQMHLDSSARRLWCVNPDNNTVTVLDADTLAKVAEVAVAEDPRSIGQDAAGLLWIPCLDADQIDLLDPGTQTVVDSLPLPHGSRPHDIVFDGSGVNAFVTLKGSGRILRIHTPTRVIQLDVDGGPTPTAVALVAAGDELLASRFISPDTRGEVRRFRDADQPGMTLDQILPLPIDSTANDDGVSGRGLPNYLADVALHPGQPFAYVTAKKDNILRGQLRDGLALTHDTTVRSIVSKLDLGSNTEMIARRIDIDDRSQPTALAFSPLGDYLFVALQGSNEVKVVDTFSDTVAATLATGLAPQGLCFDPVTNRLFIKNLTDRSVTIYDLTAALEEGDFSAAAIATVDTVASERLSAEVLLGKQVFYNAADPRMGFGYISCATCHQDGDDDGRVWDFTDRGEGLRNTTNLRGRGGMAHGNVHWSANFDEIQDFELDMVNGFGGTGFLAADGGPHPSLGTANAGRSAELDALAAYVTSLGLGSVERSPHRQSDGSLTPSAAEGRLLFEGARLPVSGHRLQCASCHDRGSEFTDSTLGNNGSGGVTLHDVGTLKASSGERLGGGPGSLNGIDTPTLLGLHAAPPYLHDGSAATLASVFDQFDASAELGESSAAHDLSPSGYDLTATEKDQLLDYLRQLDGTPDLSPIESFRLGHGMNADGSDDFEDWSGNDVANILYFLFGLGDPQQAVLPPLQISPAAAAGLPALQQELDGSYTYSYVRHRIQTDFRYVCLSGQTLEDWGDVTDPGTPWRPASDSVTALDDYHEIHHLHFSSPPGRGFFMLRVEPTSR